MKLKGHIKALKDNCFAIPVYSDGVDYYFHSVDEKFNIKNFVKTQIVQDLFIETYLSKTFEINSKGALIFIGANNFILANSADLIIDEIQNYLKDTTNEDEYLYIKIEASEIKNIISEYNNAIERILSFIFSKPQRQDFYKIEFHELQSEHLNTTKQNLVLENLKKSILDIKEFNNNKEVISNLLTQYLTSDKTILEKFILNTEIGMDFAYYLTNKDNSNYPIEITIEEALLLRGNKRKQKLKKFNHKFKNLNNRFKINSFKSISNNESQNQIKTQTIQLSFDINLKKIQPNLEETTADKEIKHQE